MIDAKYFDHTILKQDAVKEQVRRVCSEALTNHFASVCVNPYYTALAADYLKGSDVAVCTVIGFPLGMNTTKVKCFEAKTAIEDGAAEIDMVINVGALKDRCDEAVVDDIRLVKEVCQNITLKVIIETCLLSDEEKIRACKLAQEAGADFVKTSTGFSTAGATAKDVSLMKGIVGDTMKVKASGGIRDGKTAQAMIDAGADRLGTSATVDICKGE